jgi:hypothetical protein
VRSWFARLVIALFAIAIIGNVSACFADETTQPIPGDPAVVLPGCSTQEPTPAILLDAIVLLVTGGFLALF